MLHWGSETYKHSDAMMGRVTVVSSSSSMSPSALAALSRDCPPHPLPSDIHSQLSTMLWRTLGRQLLLDSASEVLTSAPGGASFTTLGSWVYSQQLSLIWSKRPPIIPNSPDGKSCEAGVDASMETAASACDEASDDGVEVGSVCEDKYARLAGLKATLDKCR
jgi:hypothetical protein